jgi:hypothetical protein
MAASRAELTGEDSNEVSWARESDHADDDDEPTDEEDERADREDEWADGEDDALERLEAEGGYFSDGGKEPSMEEQVKQNREEAAFAQAQLHCKLLPRHLLGKNAAQTRDFMRMIAADAEEMAGGEARCQAIYDNLMRVAYPEGENAGMKDFTWDDSTQTQPWDLRFKPNRKPGIHLPDECSTPLDFYIAMFGIGLHRLLHYTNMTGERRYRDKWEQLNKSEFTLFLGVSALMDVVPLCESVFILSPSGHSISPPL